LLPENFTCPKCGSSKIEKEYNILDVWFESGVSHHAVLDQREGHSSPAQMYLEGSDQHRGWFQSSLLTSVGYKGKSPFDTVLTHGFLLDGEGKAMHKSAGNAISPLETCDKLGADVLRLWVSSENYQEDVRLSGQILDRMSEAYRKIRNSLRFMINNLFDFDPETEKVSASQMGPLDQYMLAKLSQLISRINDCYEKYSIYRVFRLIYDFVVTELSAFYLDSAKDRLYTLGKKSLERKACQTVIYECVHSLTLLMAPILSFTAEEVWEYLPGSKSESVFLSNFPEANREAENPELISHFDFLIKAKGLANKAMEIKRNEKEIGHSLECRLVFFCEEKESFEIMKKYEEHLETIMIVSGVEIVSGKGENVHMDESILPGLGVQVVKQDGRKCPRCWKYMTENLFPTDQEICTRCQTATKE